MVYKGLIMEVEKNNIIVLTDDTNYVKLKKKGEIDIGKRIMFLEDDIIKDRKESLKPLMGLVAAIILIITTIIGQFGVDFIGKFQAYAIVSLDINPSLEFQIDEKEIVKKINSINRDGKALIDDSMIGMKIEDAVILSIKTAVDKQYLNTKNNVVLVSDVIIDDNSSNPTVIEDKIFDRIKEDEELEEIKVIYVNSNKEDLKKARENQVSLGKYKVYEMVSNNNPDIKIEDIKDKKVSEIVNENRELTKGEKVKTKKKEKVKDNSKDQIENKYKDEKIDDGNNGKKNGKAEKEKINNEKDNKKGNGKKDQKDKDEEDIENGQGKDREEKTKGKEKNKKGNKKNKKNDDDDDKDDDDEDDDDDDKDDGDDNDDNDDDDDDDNDDKEKKGRNKNKGKK